MNTMVVAAACLILIAGPAMADPLNPVLGPPHEEHSWSYGEIIMDDLAVNAIPLGPVGTPGVVTPDVPARGPTTTPGAGVSLGTVRTYDSADGTQLCVELDLIVGSPVPECLNKQLLAGRDGAVPRETFTLGALEPQTVPGTPGVAVPNLPPTVLLAGGATPAVTLEYAVYYEYSCAEMTPYATGAVDVYGPFRPTQQDARWFVNEDRNRIHVMATLVVDGEEVWDGTLAEIHGAGHLLGWVHTQRGTHC